ncbi:ftsH [Symbiodinium pilosum]|uniref:FtsH protein n=1 Tax=Symbiodinium pilosum TaxID=2952 RepID=A0A812ITT2_SYMPI|nr:ftsH [Symbiodinium pilosum]
MVTVMSTLTSCYASLGGDSSAVQERLQDVQQIQASAGAFAAVLADGTVVTWGHATMGGDSSAVREQLRRTSQPLAPEVLAAFRASLVGV